RSKTLLESAFSCAQQAKLVPSSVPRVRSQRRWIRGSYDRQINILRKVMSDSVVAVDPCSAHRTGLCLFFSIHELIDHECTIRRGEQFAQAHFSCWFIAIIERSWALKKLVVLNCCSRRQSRGQCSNAFTLVH